MKRVAFQSKLSKAVFLLFLALVCFGGSYRSDAQKLPVEEVNALKQIGSKLKANWDFNVNPCQWKAFSTPDLSVANNVSCDCSFNKSTVCHITSIMLKCQNLTGVLAEEFANLTFLNNLDLTRNYLNGSIPSSWASLPLVNLSLLGNRLGGRIPKEIGQITTLNMLVLEDNLLEGPLPSELSNLNSLQRLLLAANNFIGQIPVAFSKMTNLTDFRIDGSSINGTIPDFIGHWTKLQRLDIQGTSMMGPIPSSISSLTNLNYLRISDLKGSSQSFPPLQDMLYMNELVLRNCKIIGEIPQYLASMTKLKTLDLSYNNLSGGVPDNLGGLKGLQYMSADYYMFINCGGAKKTIGKDVYDEDSVQVGASTFFQSESGRWAYSSTGMFVSNSDPKYVASNISAMNVTNPDLYTTARISAGSLDYYGLCLQNGNYNVTLHFAEIMFSNDQTYSSVGRRIFDVSIQGEIVLKDFNIAEAAGGAGLAIIKSFTTLVTHNTLDINFYWAGNGTNAIPSRGIYGPLVSAIAVTPNFKPDLFERKLSLGAILGIIAASCMVIILILVAIWYFLRRRNLEDKELRGALDPHTGYFSLRQIKAATKGFDYSNKIGEGGFGPVYKGVLPDGVIIAVKQLSSKSNQGNREFINEIGIISALQHPNLVKLLGCCIEGNQLLLIYEYMENNSLARALFGREEYRLKLDWSTRRKICIGIARGLAYLHEESRLKIVHRDIKATNVLLDKDLNAKISDFGLAKLKEDGDTHISTRIAGTIGYMAPEYAMRGYLTDKADVYSFGVVTLEIVSGKSNSNFSPDEFVYLLDWAYVLKDRGNLLELVDQSLGSHYSKSEALNMLELALLCANPSPTLRPTMSTVISLLEGKQTIHAPSKPASTDDDWKHKVFGRLSHDSQGSTSQSISQSISMDGPWMDSSVSVDPLHQ
ncbi:putative LRR receptor-like serine/threonine-protein kinase [Acorus gramineus]|uniref:non-specific serine/threonine protein kinase n=1 Tax=Acorus gramineus TaxID=55184 RepID=A0AAV9BF97_ACOGR|nr:putative LRR receptor-like serine/threonine-protein kinase [Acorus gramineus]